MELESVFTREPWKKGRLAGQKAPLRVPDIWAIRVRLQLGSKMRDLALLDLAIDSKLRGCDLVSLHVGDIATVIASTRVRASCRPVERNPRAADNDHAPVHPHVIRRPDRDT